ncbi:hypothetical protein [Rhizobium phaseoli]|uniref:hypothetical protein n=1 Tax=Rhizobium phaseoli TaxID=396 RepID=UPI00160F7201|nr:hypothetical protein [Rhizobium phaseoli]MDK4727464.1 hypothetical protein [Rhizobium phaseoli]
MLVKVNTSLVGADFSFRFGEEVEQEKFAALVGNGWESLCDPVDIDGEPVEQATLPLAPDIAATDAVVETAVQPVAQDRRGRRK